MADEVDHIVPERRPVSTKNRILIVKPTGLLADMGNIHPARVGPWVVVDCLYRFREPQGMRCRLAESYSLSLDAERALPRGSLRQVEVGLAIPGIDAPEIITESTA